MLGPRPKPTPARIASSITRVILDAIRAGVGLGLGPRLRMTMLPHGPSPLTRSASYVEPTVLLTEEHSLPISMQGGADLGGHSDWGFRICIRDVQHLRGASGSQDRVNE